MRAAAIERQISIDKAKEKEMLARGRAAEAKAAAGQERVKGRRKLCLKRLL